MTQQTTVQPPATPSFDLVPGTTPAPAAQTRPADAPAQSRAKRTPAPATPGLGSFLGPTGGGLALIVACMVVKFYGLAVLVIAVFLAATVLTGGVAWWSRRRSGNRLRLPGTGRGGGGSGRNRTPRLNNRSGDGSAAPRTPGPRPAPKSPAAPQRPGAGKSLLGSGVGGRPGGKAGRAFDRAGAANQKTADRAGLGRRTPPKNTPAPKTPGSKDAAKQKTPKSLGKTGADGGWGLFRRTPKHESGGGKGKAVPRSGVRPGPGSTVRKGPGGHDRPVKDTRAPRTDKTLDRLGKPKNTKPDTKRPTVTPRTNAGAKTKRPWDTADRAPRKRSVPVPGDAGPKTTGWKPNHPGLHRPGPAITNTRYPKPVGAVVPTAKTSKKPGGKHAKPKGHTGPRITSPALSRRTVHRFRKAANHLERLRRRADRSARARHAPNYLRPATRFTAKSAAKVLASASLMARMPGVAAWFQRHTVQSAPLLSGKIRRAAADAAPSRQWRANPGPPVPIPATPVPYTARKATPVSTQAITEAIQTLIGQHEPNSAVSLAKFLETLSDIPEAEQQALTRLSDTLAENYPVTPHLSEAVRQYATAAGALKEYGTWLAGVLTAYHASEFERIAANGPNADFFDHAKNQQDL